MKLDRKGIPKRVLLGKDQRYISVYNLYRARMAQEVLRQLNESFWARANGEADDLGVKWEPLRKATLKIKRQLRDELGSYKLLRQWYKDLTGTEFRQTNPEYLKGRREQGLLNPEQQKKFEAVYKETLGDSRSSTAKTKARNAAWEAIQDADWEREFITLINIRTGRLVASTKPGTVVGGRYYAPPDQYVDISLTRTIIQLNVEYLEEVEAVADRIIIPDDITPWIVRAHEIAIQEAHLLYVTLQPVSERSTGTTRSRRGVKTNRQNQTRRNNNSARG